MSAWRVGLPDMEVLPPDPLEEHAWRVVLPDMCVAGEVCLHA